jgi:CRISPR type I-D-associated protein Csc3/Cas10d
VLSKLRLLTRAYLVNYETNADGTDARFNMINRVARGLRSDPLNLFRYLKEQGRGDENKVESLAFGKLAGRTRDYVEEFYGDIWNGLKQAIGGNDPMEIIKGLVDRYAVFYQPDLGSSSSITRPLDIVSKLLLARPKEPAQDDAEYATDIKLMMQGELMRWLERVRHQEGSGHARFYGKDISDKEAPALQDFVNFFYDQVFWDYCRRERGLLRSRLNNMKSGCEAYYATNWRKWSKKQEAAASAGEVAKFILSTSIVTNTKEVETHVPQQPEAKRFSHRDPVPAQRQVCPHHRGARNQLVPLVPNRR